jgi:hypothetical protein
MLIVTISGWSIQIGDEDTDELEVEPQIFGSLALGPCHPAICPAET